MVFDVCDKRLVESGIPSFDSGKDFLLLFQREFLVYVVQNRFDVVFRIEVGKAFGNLIIFLCPIKLIEKGMTRSDLSKQSGVPLRTIESWCRRLRVPRDVYQLLKLAKVLGCQIEDLIEPEAVERKESSE